MRSTATRSTARAVRVLKARGYELPARHFAHRIEADEIEETDLFLPMTASHMRALKRQLPADKQTEVHMYPQLRSGSSAARCGP